MEKYNHKILICNVNGNICSLYETDCGEFVLEYESGFGGDPCDENLGCRSEVIEWAEAQGYSVAILLYQYFGVNI